MQNTFILSLLYGVFVIDVVLGIISLIACICKGLEKKSTLDGFIGFVLSVFLSICSGDMIHIFSKSNMAMSINYIKLSTFFLILSLIPIPFILMAYDNIFTNKRDNLKEYANKRYTILLIVGIIELIINLAIIYLSYQTFFSKERYEIGQMMGIGMMNFSISLSIIYLGYKNISKKLEIDNVDLYSVDFSGEKWESADTFPIYDKVYKLECKALYITVICTMLITGSFCFFLTELTKARAERLAYGRFSILYLWSFIMAGACIFMKARVQSLISAKKFVWKYSRIKSKGIKNVFEERLVHQHRLAHERITVSQHYYVVLETNEIVVVSSNDYFRYNANDRVFVVKFNMSGDDTELDKLQGQDANKYDVLYG